MNMKKLILILSFFFHVNIIDADYNYQNLQPLFYSPEPRTLNIFGNEEKQDPLIQNSDSSGKFNLFDGKIIQYRFRRAVIR